MSKLLTISIPTYNRASMLDAQLTWLSAELEGFEHECDIVVSDNCSDDRTADVVANWRGRFEGRISFTTNRHDHNIGGMANIVHCIGQATGKFVWSLGDDDPIQRGAVPYILGKIKEHANLSVILLNGYGRDQNTHKVIHERFFDSTSDRPSLNSASEFETYLENNMGGVLFISSAVYRTRLVHQAFATWPDSAKNVASQAYWVAFCAARGSFIVTPKLFTECAMGIGFTDKDPKWPLTLSYQAIPEVFIRLMKSGYSRRFCFSMMLKNLKSWSSLRVLAGGIRRWPVFAMGQLVYYLGGLIVGAILFLSGDSKEIIAYILLGFIPANRKLKPIGVKPLLPNNDDSIEYLELNPPYVSTLNLSPQFISDCSDFSKPEMTVQIPGDYIVTLKNGRVYSYDPGNTAIITEDNYLIEELSFQWDARTDELKGARTNKVFTLKGLRKPRTFKGTVFSLLGGGGAKYYYYHWMIDSLPKLGLLKQSGQFDKVDYFLVPNYNAKYHKETLSHFGIGEDKIINEERVNHIQADYLMVSSYIQIKFHHPKWACGFLHNSFTLPRGDKKRETLIYIPRGDAAVNRKVLNEAELIEVLKRFGFDIRFLSEMTVPDEAEFFNSAKLVLGAQGSGFTNLIFCEPGTIVVEFFPDKYVRHIDYDICNKMDLEYHYILCPSDGEAYDTVEGQKINVTADIPAIIAKLETLLNRAK